MNIENADQKKRQHKTMPVAQIGLRARHKREKLRRIKAAASGLFTQKGFDAATTREIALRADVAHATIFLYARDKRDLIFLILNEELERLTHDFLNAAKPEMSLIDQLASGFSTYYRYYAKNFKLARIFLKELTFYHEGEQARRFDGLRNSIISHLEQLLVNAQRAGHIQCQEDLELVARDLFFAYQGALRWWIAKPKPKAADGIAEFRRIVRLHVQALNPKR